MSDNDKSNVSEGIPYNDEVDWNSDLLDISSINLPNYDRPKWSTK